LLSASTTLTDLSIPVKDARQVKIMAMSQAKREKGPDPLKLRQQAPIKE